MTDAKGGDILKTEREQLDALRIETESILTRRVTFWGLRWSLGFAVIWALVSYEPAWPRLWWAGVGLAAVSLTATVATHFILMRKFEKADLAIDRAQEVARVLDHEET